MVKKLLKLVVAGFIIGMAAGNLIAIITSNLSSGETLVFSDLLLAKAGSAAAALTIQTLFSGILGAIAMGGVILYEIDRLPMLWTCVIHYVIIELSYIPIAVNLGWIGLSLKEIGLMLFLQAIAYAIIWVIMYVRYKAEVRELNELLQVEAPEAV